MYSAPNSPIAPAWPCESGASASPGESVGVRRLGCAALPCAALHCSLVLARVCGPGTPRMKFGKQLKIHLEETLPEWRDKFVAYKKLKKRLKLLKSAPDCFAEVAFIPADEALDSDVAKVDSRLRNGSEIGHYENGLRLPGVLESRGKRRRIDLGSRAGSGSVSGSGSLSGSACGDIVMEDAGGEEEEEEEVVSREPEGAEEQRGRKRQAREAVVDGVAGLERSAGASEDQMEFVSLLNAELDKFNAFFVEKEEDYVIKLKELKERTKRFRKQTANRTELSEEEVKEMTTIYTDMIAFHGEMVLLETYSSLNYTGLVKILKKHDKWTGGVLRMPFIQMVLHQPFFTTELLSQLVKDCESNLSSFFPPQPQGEPQVQVPAQAGADQGVESPMAVNTPDSDYGLHGANSPAVEDTASKGPVDGRGDGWLPLGDNLDGVYRSAVAALKTIKDIRRGSSTYSYLSMPPLDPVDGDDTFGVVINEQVHRESPTPCRTVASSVPVSQD